jgi:alpha-tubulin suppressor-like RCC1 family protein
MRAAGSPRVSWVMVVAACALVTGCDLLSGLADLKIGEGTGGGGNDGKKNGTETAEDCGGPDCDARCKIGRACVKSSDCQSGVCREEVCVGVAKLAAGNAHVCALLDTKELFCWGQNARGQLGLGDGVVRDAPALVDAGVVVEDVAAGGTPDDKSVGHTCVRSAGGKVSCWGANGKGQLGTGDTTDASVPVLVSGLTGVKAVVAGGAFTCAIDGASAVQCWGDNASGQLASDMGVQSSSPVPAQMLGSATALSAGASHACAVLVDGSAHCWGSNGSGQVGSGVSGGSSKPAKVGVIEGVSLLRAGNDATCALDAAGFWCWGDNADAQLSETVSATSVSTPADMKLGDVASFALGGDGDKAAGNDAAGGHACVVQADKVACWGNNRRGQLGRGTLSPSGATPAPVQGLGAAVEVVLGAEFSCARLNDGGVRCWGRNDFGQLGTGMVSDSEFTPVPIAWP